MNLPRTDLTIDVHGLRKKSRLRRTWVDDRTRAITVALERGLLPAL